MSRSPRSPILLAGCPILPAGCPDENVYVPWVPHTQHKLLTPGHRSEDPWHPVGRPPPTRAVTGNICLCAFFRYFRNPCDRDPPIKNFKFFKNSLKILDVYFWGTSVYFWGSSGVSGFLEFPFLLRGGFWGSVGRGGPRRGFQKYLIYVPFPFLNFWAFLSCSLSMCSQHKTPSRNPSKNKAISKPFSKKALFLLGYPLCSSSKKNCPLSQSFR